LALVAVYFNILAPMLEHNGARAISGNQKGGAFGYSFSSGQDVSEEKVDLANVKVGDWNALSSAKAERNPFSQYKKRKSKKRYIHWPNVTAIVVGRNESYAVVNGSVVSEGQRVGGFKIVKIAADKVYLRHGARKKVVTLNAKGGK